MDMGNVSRQALDIARRAGDYLRDGFQERKEIATKSSAIDLVTQYDTGAEALITQALGEAFPQYRILAEEGDYKNGHGDDLTWIVDPLDGTINFAHGLPIFAVSMALYRGAQPLLGIIYDPIRGECFQAVAQGGAYVTNGEGDTQKLSVSDQGSLLGSLLATGFPYDRHHSRHDNRAQFGAFLKAVQGVRRMGAAALDLAYVAAGRLDGYWEYKTSIWDVAAGVLLVQEAGGRVTVPNGEPFRLGPQEKYALVASNGSIHEAMLDVLKGVTAGEELGALQSK